VNPQGLDRLDPALAALTTLATLGLTEATLPVIRQSLDSRRAEAARALDPTPVTVTDEEVDRAGAPIRVRVYRGTTEHPAPALLYCHSGAFLLGNVDTDHARCVTLARTARCVVVSVDYRLAPEHPYPAALEDCLAVLHRLRDGAWGADAARLAVGGNSAGAGLAAAVALRARDEGGPALRLQLLHQPMLDHRCATASMEEFVATPGFDRLSARFAWASYLGSALPTPYASPSLAPSLAGLPPAYIACSEVDPLRDEAIAYAQELLRAGVATELHVYPGTCHGFDSYLPDHPLAVRAVAEQCAALARALHPPAAAPESPAAAPNA
jgi:acetyl esterase